LKNASPVDTAFVVPIIEDLHKKVYECASKPDALNMGDWHTCETTHCRAGWIVTLAGEAGKKLEKQTSTLFAAMMIADASGAPISPTKFYGTNEDALADMKKCAGIE